MTDTPDLGKRLRELRTKTGLSHEDAVRRLEREDTIERAAKVMQTTYDKVDYVDDSDRALALDRAGLLAHTEHDRKLLARGWDEGLHASFIDANATNPYEKKD